MLVWPSDKLKMRRGVRKDVSSVGTGRWQESQVEIEGDFLNLIKGIYEKPIANIILSGERLKTFPLRRKERRQVCTLSELPFSKVPCTLR